MQRGKNDSAVEQRNQLEIGRARTSIETLEDSSLKRPINKSQLTIVIWRKATNVDNKRVVQLFVKVWIIMCNTAEHRSKTLWYRLVQYLWLCFLSRKENGGCHFEFSRDHWPWRFLYCLQGQTEIGKFTFFKVSNENVNLCGQRLSSWPCHRERAVHFQDFLPSLSYFVWPIAVDLTS